MATERCQLVHNVWDSKTRRAKTQVLYSFGRAEQVDVEAIRHLIRSLSRLQPAEEAQVIQEQLGEDWPFEFLGSLQLGGSALLDGCICTTSLASIYGVMYRRFAQIAAANSMPSYAGTPRGSVTSGLRTGIRVFVCRVFYCVHPGNRTQEGFDFWVPAVK